MYLQMDTEKVLRMKDVLEVQVEKYPQHVEFAKSLANCKKILTFLECVDVIQKYLVCEDILGQIVLSKEMDAKLQPILDSGKFKILRKLSDLPPNELQGLSNIFKTFASCVDPSLVQLHQ